MDMSTYEIAKIPIRAECNYKIGIEGVIF